MSNKGKMIPVGGAKRPGRKCVDHEDCDLDEDEMDEQYDEETLETIEKLVPLVPFLLGRNK